jgi:hypothetical protein
MATVERLRELSEQYLTEPNKAFINEYFRYNQLYQAQKMIFCRVDSLWFSDKISEEEATKVFAELALSDSEMASLRAEQTY